MIIPYILRKLFNINYSDRLLKRPVSKNKKILLL